MFSVCYKQNKTFLIVSREATDSSRPDVFISDPIRFHSREFIFRGHNLGTDDSRSIKTNAGERERGKENGGGSWENGGATPSMVCCDCDLMAWPVLIINISKRPYLFDRSYKKLFLAI